LVRRRANRSARITVATDSTISQSRTRNPIWNSFRVSADMG